MVLGLDHSKKMLADFGIIAVDVIKLVKHGVGLGAIREILALMQDVKAAIKEAPLALPELKSIDGAEAAELAECAYDLVKQVIEAMVV